MFVPIDEHCSLLGLAAMLISHFLKKNAWFHLYVKSFTPGSSAYYHNFILISYHEAVIKPSRLKEGCVMKNLRYLAVRTWQVGKRMYAIVACKSAFMAAAPLIDVVGLGLLVDALIRGRHLAEVLRILVPFVCASLACRLVDALLKWQLNIALRQASNVIAFDFAKDNLAIDYHYVQDSSLENRRKRSMRMDPGYFTWMLGVILSNIIQFAGILTICIAFAPPFIALLLATGAILVILTFALRTNEVKLADSKVEDERKLDYLFTVMTDYVYAKEVRLNQADAYVKAKFVGVLEQLLCKARGFYARAWALDTASTLVSIAQTVAMYLYFSYLVTQGSISLAQYTVLLNAATLLNAALLNTFDTVAQLRMSCSFAQYHREYCESVASNSVIIGSNSLPQRELDFFQAQYAFDHVSFTYPTAEIPTLRDIHVTLRLGERVGIVGANGSGKTTFVKLLTRLYDPTEGSVTVNGVDIRTLPYAQYNRHVAVVLQDFFLFAYSIQENIVFDSPRITPLCAPLLKKAGW